MRSGRLKTVFSQYTHSAIDMRGGSGLFYRHRGGYWREVRTILIMRTKDITDCFEIGLLVGFSITIRNIMAWCPCSADIGNGNSPPGVAQGQ